VQNPKEKESTKTTQQQMHLENYTLTKEVKYK
jgi:hypothetical protein